MTMRTRSLVDRLLGLPAKSNRNIAVHADLPVPMRDGAVLYADRYAPMGQGHAPVVLMRTPYGRKHLWKRLYCLPFAQRGYQVVIQSCRGTEDSVEQLVPFDERDDGLDTVAWLRAQPWYPGRFVAFGPSYWGLAQWALADGAADDLAAMVAVLTSSRMARSLSFGGAFALEAWLKWSAVIAAQADRRPGFAAVMRTRSRRVARALRHLPLRGRPGGYRPHAGLVAPVACPSGPGRRLLAATRLVSGGRKGRRSSGDGHFLARSVRALAAR
jgi:predicted acyl esterase